MELKLKNQLSGFPASCSAFAFYYSSLLLAYSAYFAVLHLSYACLNACNFMLLVITTLFIRFKRRLEFITSNKYV